VGDALGAAVEFMSSSEIKNKYGEDGIHDPQCIISANAET